VLASVVLVAMTRLPMLFVVSSVRFPAPLIVMELAVSEIAAVPL